MPKKEHAMLVRRANALGLKGERRQAYIYGTLQKIEERRAAKRKRAKA